jgi:hypothetical protein
LCCESAQIDSATSSDSSGSNFHLVSWDKFVEDKQEAAKMKPTINVYQSFLLKCEIDYLMTDHWSKMFFDDFRDHNLLTIIQPLDGGKIELNLDKLDQQVKQSNAAIVITNYSQFVQRSLFAKQVQADKQDDYYNQVKASILNFISKTNMSKLLRKPMQGQSHANMTLQKVNNGKVERRVWNRSDLRSVDLFFLESHDQKPFMPYLLDIDLVGESSKEAILSTLHPEHRPESERNLLNHTTKVPIIICNWNYCLSLFSSYLA